MREPSSEEAPPGGGSDAKALREVAALALKLGCIAFGGPAAHIGLLREEVVTRRRWLSEQHFLDLLGATNLIPGPNSTEMVIHVGHERAGWKGLIGAVLATVGIFLPSFVFVAAVNPLVPRLRRSPWMAGLLDGVNVAAVGLMAAVTWELGRAAILDPLTGGLAVAAGVLLIRFKINSAWLVLGGGMIGLAYRFVAG